MAALTLAPGVLKVASAFPDAPFEDVTGSGHRWRLVDGAPWRRVYVTLA